MGTPAWKERMGRYRSTEGAVSYREKHRRSLVRRLADGREKALLEDALLRLGAVDSVLDCPCGAGRFLPLLAARAPRIGAVDQSAPLVGLARAECPGAAFAVGDATALPFRDRSFDAVVCMRLLHHFPDGDDRIRILREAARVARRGVVVSFADADTRRGARSRSRRRPIPRTRLAEEARAAGLRLDPDVRTVQSWFSAFSFALLRLSES